MKENTKTLMWESWNKQISHAYSNLYTPKNLEELSNTIKDCESLRVLGTGKSSADICGGSENLLSLDNLNKVLALGSGKKNTGKILVEAEAGISLKDLLMYLEAQGYCIPALPDIDDISLGGAIATGTHGTGKSALSLSDYVAGVCLLTAEGKILALGDFPENSPRPSDEKTEAPKELSLEAFKVSLGLLGVSYSISLEVQKLFTLAIQEKRVRNAQWEKYWPYWQEAYDFTRVLFLPHTGYGWLILGKRYDTEAPFGPSPENPDLKNRRTVSHELYRKAQKDAFAVIKANKILQRRFFSKPLRRLGSLYKTTVTSSRSGTMVLAEWTVPFSRFEACFKTLRRRLENRSNPAGAHIPMDVRFFRKSDAWLANSWEEDTVSLGCVCRVSEIAKYYKAFDIMEETFLEFGGRPHWAKTFKCGPEMLKTLYPKMQDFIELRRIMDPSGKFLNTYLKQYFE